MYAAEKTPTVYAHFCGRLDGGSRTWQLYAFFAWICLTLHTMFHVLLVDIVSHVSICTA